MPLEFSSMFSAPQALAVADGHLRSLLRTVLHPGVAWAGGQLPGQGSNAVLLQSGPHIPGNESGGDGERNNGLTSSSTRSSSTIPPTTLPLSPQQHFHTSGSRYIKDLLLERAIKNLLYLEATPTAAQLHA